MKAKKTIQKIEPYQVDLFDEEGFLKLDSNENDFGPSPKVVDAIKNISPQDIKYYPYYGKLIQKLADFHGVGIENIILTAGADEAISSIFSTFLESGQTVLTVEPSFVMPRIYAKVNGLNFKEISYKKKWEFPQEEFLKNIDNADLIHLTTPNSPTGEIIDRKVIEKIIKKANGKAILIDETYANFCEISNLDLARKNENIFIVRSFSKDFALAGLRLGYVISSEENISNLRKYLSPYNVSNLSVKAGLAALDDIQYFKKVKKEIEVSKEMLIKGLKKLDNTIYPYPSETNFLCVDFGQKAEFIYKKLLDAKIKVKYFKNIPLLENTMRITVPTLENTKKILSVLEKKTAIVFDMDGVLIDASKSYRVAVQKTFEHFAKKEFSLEKISQTKKLGGLNNDWDLTEYLLKSEGLKIDYDDIVEVFQGHYKTLAQIEEPLVSAEFFEELSKDYNLVVFTGRLVEEAYYSLDKNNFTKYFYPIITMQDVGLNRQKPDPLGLEIVKQKIIADEIYYLGDTVDDMICAQKAGVKAIGVLPPQDKSEDLKNLLKSKKAVVVLEQTVDLKNYLKEGRYAQKH
ncbi:MAG TPA: histidinol-phosphate transaminase [Candidatus Gastranaerophilaceae bacterium]|nr:histidinol-phosphate transaminase [Candidatus Gastranaerophilaceae bacterium]HPT41812.1 histidinol-phosphate transaminase [Candidatus Gastranaerophilaceae bacterium]